MALGGAATTVALAPWKGVGLLPAVTSLLIGHSRFDPAYLERYLDGYGIPDHASFVFWGDRDLVSARFSAVHIVQLAAAFGRDVQLLLRRTDRQEPSKSEFPLIIAALMKPRASLGLLVAQAATLLGCRVPAQAVDLRWPGALEKDARYELSVALPLKDDEPVAGDPELAGITFSTSSYKNPQELVERFGLVAAAAGDELLAAHASGDLRVNAVTLAAGATVDDSAFEAAVTALGLPPLRPVSEPRSSVLWTRTADGRWGVQGVLLESTEPMIRDDGRRMSLGDAQLGDDSLPVRRANHAGTRALWLASAPVVPEQPLTFGLTATDRGVPFTRRLMVPPEPRFANTALAAVA